MNASTHEAVMTAELVAALAPRDGGIYVDGTFGAGGHSCAILRSADCSLFAIDRDPHAIRNGASILADFADHRRRVRLLEGRFSMLAQLLEKHAISAVDGVVLDVGVSSMQLQQAQRGFSFLHDGPLDMRMSARGTSAADVVNHLPEADLARVIAVYGEEKQARKVARAIVAARKAHPVAHTAQLAAIVASALNSGGARHPATRVFQALRILVNDELGELARGLCVAEQILKPGGRLAVITFHSLEDRLVKRFLQARCERSGGSGISRHLPAPPKKSPKGRAPSFRLLFAKPQRPGSEELARNHRARSARLRAAERTSARAFAGDDMLAASAPVVKRPDARMAS